MKMSQTFVMGEKKTAFKVDVDAASIDSLSLPGF